VELLIHYRRRRMVRRRVESAMLWVELIL
jgi:hypothetical protein